MERTTIAGTSVVVQTKNPRDSRTLWVNYSWIAAVVLVAVLEVLQQAGPVLTIATLSGALIAGLNAYLRYGTSQPLTVTNNLTGPIAQVGGVVFKGPTTADAIAGGEIANLNDNKSS